jgi:hypothetical protein
MKTGKYIKPNGEQVEVINFDEINKLVQVKFERGKQEYYHENEYKNWVGDDLPFEGYPEPGEVEAEEIKPKRGRKKKTE